ncbi:hypothetical protein BGZ98_003354, partial [Dissophora globulifera]
KSTEVAYFVPCDVTKYEQLADLFKAAFKHFGGVDIVINNAGIAELIPLWEDKKGVWKKVVEIDLLAVIEGTRLGIEAFKKLGRGGVIVNTASLAGIFPQIQTPAYSAAKFGVVGFTRSFKEFDPSIRVNAVAPGLIEPIKDDIVRLGPLVTVQTVIDAFMLLIEDDSYIGDIARVSAQSGISVQGRAGNNDKKKKAKL